MSSNSPAHQIKEIASLKDCPPCIAIISPDRSRRERSLTYLLDTFAPSRKDIAVFRFSDGKGNLPAFLEHVAEPSLFEPVTFAVLKGLEVARAADLEPLSAFIAKPRAGVHLFLVGSSFPNSPRFKKQVDTHAETLNFAALKGAELRRWTERELKRGGISEVSDEIVEMILASTEEDPDSVVALVQKFALLLDGAPPSAAILSSLTPGRSHASDFDLAEQLLSGKRAATEILLHKLLTGGSSPFMLTGLLAKTFISLLRIRILIDRGLSPKEIKDDLGISPWLLTKYTPLAKRYRAEAWERYIEALLTADFRLKDRSLGPAAVFGALACEISRGES